MWSDWRQAYCAIDVDVPRSATTTGAFFQGGKFDEGVTHTTERCELRSVYRTPTG
jgi:hypothetical protein